MKKVLPTSEIQNQLAGSVFFENDKPIDARAGQQTTGEELSPNNKPGTKQTVHDAGHTNPPSTSEELDRHDNNRTDTPNERTAEPNGDTERSSVVTELEEGVRETKRPTERYSFEIFSDMKEKIEDIQYQYKKKTGKKLSASRIIREALEVYFRKIEEAF